MEELLSTSKVTVEYHDPHDVYKLLAPGLVPRLPLRHLHWQSHAGPLRSIDTLHLELVPAASDAGSTSTPSPAAAAGSQRVSDITHRDDGFQTAAVGGRPGSTEYVDALAPPARSAGPKERRHQIPGLRRTPYLKILFVRCDDNDSYKSQTRSEVREWIKQYTITAQSTKKLNVAETHDAFEWLIVHVVIPNTAAASQPRTSKTTDGSTPDLGGVKSTSRWGKSTSTLLEKFRSEFNGGSKNAIDRITQIRIGINDVPYDVLPRVVPAVPSGYAETEKDAENAWQDLVDKMKSLILSSFDVRVLQYEEDIREKDAQRSLPGWNFCTFFILKEGLARGFESVGLVDDALVVYDELSVGLDTIIAEQAAAGSAEAHGGALLGYTEDLRRIATRALRALAASSSDGDAEEPVNLESADGTSTESFEEALISPTKKAYRELILANNVSVFDFRCYIFARQITLLLRLGNASSSREELLAKLKEQQESVLHGVAPRAPPPKPTDETENLSMLAEVCRRTLEFIPAVSQVMRGDIVSALAAEEGRNPRAAGPGAVPDAALSTVVDNVVASYAFSIAQQILAQTSTKALPIPPSAVATPDGHEPKTSIPEPKTMMHPARSSSLHLRAGGRGPPSPGIFPGPGSRSTSAADADAATGQFLKVGLEELAARRAELYTLSRHILEESGKQRGWTDGWASVPTLSDKNDDIEDMEDVDLDEEDKDTGAEVRPPNPGRPVAAGLDNKLLRTALAAKEDFYRLYETLTDKALRHYTVAGHTHSKMVNLADLAVLKFHLGEFAAAASYFRETTPFFGESGWSLLELSMLMTYSGCLRELGRDDEYVRVVLKLLSKAAKAERERLVRQSSVRLGGDEKKRFPARTAIHGYVDGLLAASATLPSEVHILLANFFSDVEIDGPPTYGDEEDSFSITLNLRNLLAERLPLDSVKVRLLGFAGGQPRDIWVESRGQLRFDPGKNKVKLYSNSIVPGTYEVDQIRVVSRNLHLQLDREHSSTGPNASTLLKNPRITLYQRAGSFDLNLYMARHRQLYKDHALILEVSTGWNDITTCELNIRSASGGLRLVTSEAQVIGSPLQISRAAEAGLLVLNSIRADTTVRIRLPFTLEQELQHISVRVDATYSTDKDSFVFCKTPSVDIALGLAVNVQDVFKHEALFSKFTVSTVSTSPLRVFKSELLGSDVFDSQFGVAPGGPVTVFPRQPASLLYRITRKHVRTGPNTQKTMHLKLLYSVLLDEVEDVLERSITAALQDGGLLEFSRVVLDRVRYFAQTRLSALDLERTALLGELPTGFLAEAQWEKEFAGLGSPNNGPDLAKRLATFMLQWQTRHRRLSMPDPDPTVHEPRSILIPVDIPSVSIVHTADMRLGDGATRLYDEAAGTATASLNQLIPATLHLKWTRIWSTADTSSGEDVEFSFEITAPTDAWILAGRRKGHFVIPAPGPDSDGIISSTADSEAAIPLLLIPLREGWLPYPVVEIRQVLSGPDESDGSRYVHYETDYRNLGEAVRVIPDRHRITLSLNASGPGGGPLVLESEGRGQTDAVIV